MDHNHQLPLIGRTSDVDHARIEEHWRSVFSGVWGGNLEFQPVKEGQISGSLHSQKVGDLTFNRIEFGHQQFERSRGRHKQSDEPFYSLTFPESGEAMCQIGELNTRLVPQKAYLLNNGLTAKLRVERDYSTFNVQIPVCALEHRLGRKTNVLSKPIVQPDAIFHMMQRLVAELLNNVETFDAKTAGFMTNQMLDTVAFFLTSSGSESEDSLAMQAVRARILAFIDARYNNPDLTPKTIAQHCGISRSYLYKVFAEGPSVMERLRHRRLEAARGMIEFQTPSLNMTEVAMACGFSNSSEFSRLFKGEYGTAPSKY
ncbi:AraC family transcriptional regulator [Yoonia sp. MH D7]